MSCSCTPAQLNDGRHDVDCLVHQPYRCTVRGCECVAVSGGECAVHERRWVG